MCFRLGQNTCGDSSLDSDLVQICSVLQSRFTHTLTSVYEVARLFDVMLLHPILSLYVAAAV